MNKKIEKIINALETHEDMESIEILEELGYCVEVERHLETDDWGQGHYNISLKIRWD